MDSIFVQITSYRDPECQWTVKDLFAKAAHPERVFVGICWQFNEFEDKACFTQPYPRPGQVRTLTFHPRESKGSNWARIQAQSLWRGETYVLQIHAHMRFERDWDETLIATLARCGDRAVLATCLPGYAPPNDFPHRDKARSSFVMVDKFTPRETQLLYLLGGLYNKTAPHTGPTRSPFWVGNFLFARSELMLKVPFDPHIFYYGENIAYSARLFTHGYDIFEPDQLVAYHWWGRTAPVARPYRDPDSERHTLSTQRVKHLLHLEAAESSAALSELDQYGLGDARSLHDFWRFAGLDPRTGAVEEFARKGKWDESYARLQAAQKAPAPELPRIFVMMESYRDPECQWTVKDLFDKAAHPERISVGICWQADPAQDQDCFQIATRPAQVKTVNFHWNESKGTGWARHQAQQFFNGEEYCLIIDSRTRFAFDWDERLIAELALCASAKPVLSSSPSPYTPPHDLEVKTKPAVQRAHLNPKDGDIRFYADTLDRAPEKPLRGAFIAASFMFGRSDFLREVPYDPGLYIYHDEVAMAARLFTHGFDVFSPSNIIVYHDYNTLPDQKKRPHHWHDHADWNEANERSRRRLAQLLGRETASGKESVSDPDAYGLGKARSLADYEAYSGLDFKNNTVSERALRAQFIENLERYKTKPVHVPEIDGTPEEILKTGLPVLAFPDPALSVKQPFDSMIMANQEARRLNVDKNAPEGVLIIYDYIEKPICDALARYADAQNYSEMDVVNPLKSTSDRMATEKHAGRVTHHVDIDGMASEILTIFNDIYCRRLAPFYNVNFEWYERPQILRYPPGGKYNQHADSDHWVAEQDKWIRVQDRDYSVLLYLNEDYEGGELHFVEQDFKIKPRAGMLVAFPSDARYLHAALPTTSGIRYVIVSWAAIVGSPRVRTQMPYASVFIRQKR